MAGGGQQSPAPAASAAAPITGAPASYTLPLTATPIKLVYAGGESNNPEYSLADNREVWQIISQRTGVTLDIQVLPGPDYNVSIRTRIAANDIPDIFWCPGIIDPIGLYNDGLVQDMDTLIRRYAPNIYKVAMDSPDVLAAMTASDGRFYFASTESVADFSTNPRTMFYRRDWQRKLNIPDPVTIDDIFNMFVAFRDKDPNGNGKADEVPVWFQNLGNLDVLGSAFDVMSIGWNNGWSYDKNKTVRYDFVRPEFKNYLAFLNKMYNAKMVPPEVYFKSGTDTPLIAANCLGAYTNGIGALETRNGTLLKGGYISDASDGFFWLTPPVNQVTGKRELYQKSVVNSVSGYIIGKACKYPEVAIKWLDYVWGSREGQLMMELGIEGKTYTVTNGKIMMTDFATKNPDGLGVQQVLRTLGCIPPNLSRQTNETFYATWTYSPFLLSVIDYAAPYYTLPCFPTFMGTPDEKAEEAKLSSDMGTYRDEMVAKFITGQTPLSEFDKYVDQMNKLGVTRLIEINQRRINDLLK